MKIDWLLTAGSLFVFSFLVSLLFIFEPVQASTASADHVEPEAVDQVNPLADVRISGSWQFGDGRIGYLFSRGSVPITSEEYRQWAITPYNPCAASISYGEFTTEVYCSFADSVSPAPGVVRAAIPTGTGLTLNR